MGIKLGVDKDSIQYNNSLEQYASNIKKYSNICSTDHIGTDFIVDLENVPKLSDKENDEIFKRYLQYLIKQGVIKIGNPILASTGIQCDSTTKQLIADDLVTDRCISGHSTKFSIIENE